MAVARLRLRIISTWEGEDETNGIRTHQGTLEVGFGRVGNTLRRTGGMRLWMKAAIITAPAMFTLGKHLLGVVGGLATLGAVVASAAAPWVALAVTAARNASEMGSAGQRFAASADRVGAAWMDLARSTAPLTLGPVTDVLNGIAAAIPKLEPLVREVAPDFARMGRDIGAWLSGNGFERFLQNINDYGVPAFRNLAAAGRDFVATVGIGFREFQPLAQDIANTVERGARRMASAARQGGIARWLDDWRRNAPTASRFLREAAETIGIVGQLLNDVGPGVLGAVNAGLSAFSALDPNVLMATVLAWAAGKTIAGLAAAIAMVRAMRSLRLISFVGANASLLGAAAALTGAAAALLGLAADILALAARLATSIRIRVDSSALDRIKEIWDSVPKSASATFNGSGFSAAMVMIGGIFSTWNAVQSNLAAAIVATAQVNSGVMVGVATAILAAWIAVRVVAASLPTFIGVAENSALLGMNAIIVAWARVRAIASIPVVFTALATPGTVPTVAAVIIAAWARVVASSMFRPVFTATATPGNVISGSAQIIAAWRRVTSMPKSWSATGRVNAGNVPGQCNAVVSAWRGLYGLARSWSAVAIVVVNGGFGGLGGGSAPINIGQPFLTFPYAVFNPNEPPNPQFADLGLGDNTTIDYGDTSDYFGDEGGKYSDPDPFDFGGDFGDGLATGGYVGINPRRYGNRSTLAGGRRRHVTIDDDVWIRNEQDLIDIIASAM